MLDHSSRLLLYINTLASSLFLGNAGIVALNSMVTTLESKQARRVKAGHIFKFLPKYVLILQSK